MQDDLAKLLEQGLKLNRIGRHAEALTFYEQALALAPTDVDALNNAAATLIELGRNEEALSVCERILALVPRYAKALQNRGTALERLERYDASLKAFDQALEIEPHNLATLKNRSTVLVKLGRHADAEASYEHLIQMEPGNSQAMNNRGVVLGQMGRHGEALEAFGRVLAMDPRHIEAWINCGTSLEKLGRNEEALQKYDRALDISRDHAEALRYRANVLVVLGRHEEALAAHDRALAKNPTDLETLNSRGNVLVKMRRFEDALGTYADALKVNPDYHHALHNHGIALMKLHRHEEALRSLDRALEIKPDFVEAMANRAAVLLRLGRYQEALASCDHAQRMQPEFARVHFLEGMIRLLLGDYELGWKKYEWRWADKDHGIPRRTMTKPLWMGASSISRKSIFLHAEQGLGDVILSSRYAAVAASRGADVVLEVPGTLAPLFAGQLGASKVVERGASLNADFHCPLLSMPLACGTTLQTIPASIPYLAVDPGVVAQWRAKLSPKKEKLIGVCWRGSADYQSDHERSIGFAEFAPLLSCPGARFVSLQKELTEEERELTKNLRFEHPGLDFRSTAEMIAALDLVISVDTVWTHWTGAIGRPFWVLLPVAPHWVWLTERADSPWYPTARLFRQVRAGDWKEVIQRAKKELARWLDTV